MQHFNSALQQLNNPQLQEFMQKLFHTATVRLANGEHLFELAVVGVILIGAAKMQSLRSYGVCSHRGHPVAMVPCLTPCCGYVWAALRHLGAGGFEQAGSEVAFRLMNHDQPNHPPFEPRPSLDVPFDESIGDSRAWLVDGAAIYCRNRSIAAGSGGFCFDRWLDI
jgi:hypothetical protein